MKRFAILLLLTPGLFAHCGAYGSVYQNTIKPETTAGVTNVGSLTGIACSTSYVATVATGDSSIKAAAAAGGISTVKAIDKRLLTVLGSVYVRECTHVHGD